MATKHGRQQGATRRKEEQAAERDEKGRFAPGKSGNPNGRPKGSGTATIKVRGRVRTKGKARGGASTRLKKGQALPGAGRRKGSRNRSSVMSQVMALAYRHAPALAEHLVKLGLDSDRAAAKIMMDLAINGATCWTFATKRESFDDLAVEYRKIQDAIAQGDISPQHATAIYESLDKSKEALLAQGGNDRRTEFEREQLALQIIQRDPVALQAATTLVDRFNELEQAAIESGELSGPTAHPLIEVARAGVSKTVAKQLPAGD